jgi:hypothetical protein
MRRFGVLMHSRADEPEAQARLLAFLQGLQEAGWAIGRNLRLAGLACAKAGFVEGQNVANRLSLGRKPNNRGRTSPSSGGSNQGKRTPRSTLGQGSDQNNTDS